MKGATCMCPTVKESRGVATLHCISIQDDGVKEEQ